MPLSEALYLPLFSSEEQLSEVMGKAGAPYTSIKMVEDGREFIQCLPEFVGKAPLKVIVNPWFTESGTVRFTEIHR